ncbi:MAG: two-component sensor histidine kinase [Deltaproteobacteria bacterium HGW-Deltaproteobacteria-15]|nr:MAG: two-component sensor histidine kinase [Deltaproteobacteria bacterium HGW-Deltaproteobacteria-15]
MDLKMRKIFYSTRSKLIISIMGSSFLVGVVSLFVGSQILYKSVLSEANIRVSSDLNAAREAYQGRIKLVKVSLNITTLGSGFVSALKQRDIWDLQQRLGRLSREVGLDFAGIVTDKGNVLCRIGLDPVPDESPRPPNPIAELAIKRRVPIAGTVVLSEAFLSSENPALADLARVPFSPASMAEPTNEGQESSGMALAAAIPVFDQSEVIGVLYGGILLNRSESIVDGVRDTVFLNETYKGRAFGAMSIFLNDLRISTNTIARDGKRAIGTRVSKEVKDRVLRDGGTWTQRAFVVNDWYLTAYEPITDIHGNKAGILGLGILEEKYLDIRRKALFFFVLITAAGTVLAFGLGSLLAGRIMDPVHRLIQASRQVSEGNYNPEVGPISRGEIGGLQKTFKDMVAALGQKRVESEHQLLHSVKQASVGRLAAGVAHEINNPLTGVLTYTHMLLRRKDLNDEVRSDLETIAKATERVRKIVKGLLDFSRQTSLHREPAEINRLVKSAVSLMENQALVKGIRIKCHPGQDIPMLTVDWSQMQGVLLNIILNALDATEPGGEIKISTNSFSSATGMNHKGVEIAITDTGSGIQPDNLEKIFEPFFTTKEVGKGTGLGLAISLGIVQRHGGTIRVQSKVGEGSAFCIWLPIEDDDD